MNRRCGLPALAAIAIIAAPPPAVAQTDTRPDILLIVADDLGFSDVGAYGSEIRTPHIDALAQQGVQLTGFHTSPTCGPTRAMLMSGVDHHQAGLGSNAAALMRLPELRGRPGYEGHLNDRVVTFATLLQDAGYRTYMTGKWDLGIKQGMLPVDRGFDEYFGIGHGGASHFSDKIGTQSPIADAAYFDGRRRLEKLPDDFYSSRTYTEKLLQFIEGNGADDQPFLAYLAFTAPHWPLQVPDEWLDRYKGEYDSGWDEIRRTRLQRQKELGIVSQDTELPPRHRAAGQWTKLFDSQRNLETRRMELYAAMVEYMDEQIGRVLEALQARQQDRELIVIFLSDNGSEGNAIGTLLDNEYWVPNNFDNRLDNLGRQGSYTWLGPGWAQAGSTPLDLFKSFVSGGGIRTPAVLWSSAGRFDGGVKTGIVTVRDIAPTILDLAGVEHPGAQYKGRSLVPVSGKSALPYLQGDADTVHGDAAIGWELYGNRALIKGEFKALLTWPPEGDGQWQLFDIIDDPAESRDLADARPELMRDLVAEWQRYAEEKGVAIFDRDLGYGRY
jgi:arylsulfatase